MRLDDASHTGSFLFIPQPGTGKTSTVTELIMQAVHRDMKLLVCAPSNIAVDTVLARLARNVQHSSDENGRRKKYWRSSSSGAGGQLRMVRLGHPAKMSSDILMYSLDSLIATDEVRVGVDVMQDSDLTKGAFLSFHRDRGQRS